MRDVKKAGCFRVSCFYAAQKTQKTSVFHYMYNYVGMRMRIDNNIMESTKQQEVTSNEN